MSKILLLLALLVALQGAQKDFWTNRWESVLKKDQFQQLIIDNAEVKRALRFSWTLYVNRGIVIHSSYDGVISQQILYDEYSRNRFRVDVIPALLQGRPSFIMIEFKKFDAKKEEATFNILLKNYKRDSEVNFIENKRID